jgi:general secretion pathway protein N
MKRIWPLATLGIVAFVALGLITLPAKVVLSRLGSYGVQAGGVTGPVWNGTAQVLQVRGANLGRVNWKLHALPLFIGRLSIDLRATRSDGSVQTSLTASPSRLRFADLRASLPLSSFPPGTIPGGWAGMLVLQLEKLELANGWPTAASGTVEVVDVIGPANRQINMGRYKVTFPADAPAAVDGVVGALSDTGGPLQVSGTVHLKNDRTFLAEGLVAARPDAPQEVARSIQYIGSPDAQGRRPFSIENRM